MSTGPDTLALLHALHRALTDEITRRLKTGGAGQDLGTARRFLRDQGMQLVATDEAERKKLKAIRRLYLQRLHDGLKEERPTAALLMEVFRFMSAAGVLDGIGSHMEARKALAQLTAADLPYQ